MEKRLSNETIMTFMRITGTTELVAIQTLKEHACDLNDALSARFSDGDRDIASRSTEGGFLIPNPNFSGGLIDGSFDSGNREPVVTHPYEVTQIPVQVEDRYDSFGQSTNALIIEDVSDTMDSHYPEVHGIVIIDGDDDYAGSSRNASQQNERMAFGVNSDSRGTWYDDMPEHGNDVEEGTVGASIEAFKEEAETIFEEQGSINPNEVTRVIASEGNMLSAGSSSIHDENDNDLHEDGDEDNHEDGDEDDHEDDSEDYYDDDYYDDDYYYDESEQNNPQHRRNPLQTDEFWGGISPQEYNEAMVLEGAMFGRLPEGGYYPPYAPHQIMGRERSISQHDPCPPSQSLEAQRLIRQQQDEEYLAALKADQERELRAKAEAEAALEAERRREEERCRQLEEEKELEIRLAAKEAFLPQEPPAEDDNVITLMVRMPDGSRRSRRFLKSDKLQLLFDFIDITRKVKPDTYRLVRTFPRRAFSNEESDLILSQLGLTSKQEALYLELI